MKLLDKIGIYFLRRGYRPSAHKRRAVNLAEVQNLIVVATANTQDEANDKVRNFNLLKKNWGIPKVSFYLMIPLRKLPEWAETYEGFTIMVNKDTNWYGKPLEINQKESADLLLDLDSGFQLSTLYLSVMLKAKMKVSRIHNLKEPYFDFFISTKEQSSTSEFIKQAEHYLRLINAK